MYVPPAPIRVKHFGRYVPETGQAVAVVWPDDGEAEVGYAERLPGMDAAECTTLALVDADARAQLRAAGIDPNPEPGSVRAGAASRAA